MFAASHGYNDIIELMLEKGADVNFKGYENYTPLMDAVRSNNLETVKFLLEKGADVNLKNKNNKTALLFSWNEDIIKLLLEHGADVNAKNQYGITFLYSAVYNGQDKFTDLAIKYGANPNVLSCYGESILFNAVKLKDTKILESLLSIKGIDVNIKNKDEDRETALLCAVKQYKIEHVKLLLDAGANPNTLTSRKMPVLIYAIQYPQHVCDKEKVVKLLLEAGADINIRNKDDFYPDEINDTPLITSVRKYSLNITNLLLKNKANVNLKNKFGNTALWYAVDKDSKKFAESLIKAGANLNIKNNKGWTVLMNAVYKNKLEMVKLLLENGANVGEKNPIRKDTVLNYVNHSITGIDKEIEELLKQYSKSKKKEK
jgi:ankyrin repeat protein